MKTLKIALMACGLITLNATPGMADWIACPADGQFKWSLGNHEEGYSVWQGRIAPGNPPWNNMTVTFTEDERSKIIVHLAANQFPGYLTCVYIAKHSSDRYLYTHLSTNIPELRGKICNPPIYDPNSDNWGFNCQ